MILFSLLESEKKTEENREEECSGGERSPDERGENE